MSIVGLNAIIFNIGLLILTGYTFYKSGSPWCFTILLLYRKLETTTNQKHKEDK